MPFLRKPELSCTCCEENLPFFFNSNFTLINATQIAIINTLNSRVSIIFTKFAVHKEHFSGAKVAFLVKKTK